MLKCLVILLAVSLSACSSLKRQSDRAGGAENESSEGVESDSEVDSDSDLPEVAELPTEEDSSSQISSKSAVPYKSPLGEVALDRNSQVDKWITYFQGRGRPFMTKYLERSTRYLPMMKNTLREHGLPEDLVYVALIESGFSPIAHSHADAVGYWQFIRGTGRRYGLKQDGYVDERRDPVLSTRAAAEYFKALYNLFGSWHLSLAAYNTGENRVKNRVMRHYTRDYWVLNKKKAFPSETRNYVPKFIAATMIAKDPKGFGFTDIEYQAPLNFETAVVPHPVSLAKISEGLGTSIEDLKMLNPKYRGDYVPMYDGKETVLRLPVGKAQNIAALWGGAEVKVPPVVALDHTYHRIRRGETLSHIAAKYRTSVGNLKRMNNMGSRTFLRVGKKLRVPDRGGRSLVAAAPAASTESKEETSSKSLASVEDRGDVHVVRRGENLSLIARRYNITVYELMRINQLSRRSILKVGQRLMLKEQSGSLESSSRKSARKVVVVSKVQPISHTVRAGENLTLIAKKYEVSVDQLKKQNKLKSGHVMVGQKLKLNSGVEVATSSKVSTRKSPKQVHVVRRGETLTSIASKYKVSLKDIASANELSKKQKRVLAGQSLIIPN